MWIGIIGTLLGAVVGGSFVIISARIQHRYQTERETNKLILSKMEELFSILAQYRDAASKEVFKTFRKLSLKIIEQHPDLLNSNLPMFGTEVEVVFPPLERIQILMGFYAPELIDHYEAFMKCFVVYSKLTVRIAELELYKAPDDQKQKAGLDLHLYRNELDLACQAMEAQIIHVARRYV